MDAEATFGRVRLIQSDIRKSGAIQLAVSTPTSTQNFPALYEALVTFTELRDATRKLYLDGHYARAVEEAYKCINNTVKAKSRLLADGQDLMNRAFSEKNPVLKLNELKSDSDRNEQAGYMLIFAGCMTGIRNPRAHEHTLWDSPAVALELLAFANHLMSVIHKTRRVRGIRKTRVSSR
jgi:uncharacterized protein (TIGR02391 family)